MSQPHDSQQDASEQKFGFAWAIVILGIGIVLIGLSTRAGKTWDYGEILYDIGMAVFTVALVELMIIRAFKLWANRKTSLERQRDIALGGLANIISEIKKVTEAPLKYSEFDATIGLIETKLDLLTHEVTSIKRDVEAIRERKD
jgi:hypothetical protein